MKRSANITHCQCEKGLFKIDLKNPSTYPVGHHGVATVDGHLAIVTKESLLQVPLLRFFRFGFPHGLEIKNQSQCWLSEVTVSVSLKQEQVRVFYYSNKKLSLQ